MENVKEIEEEIKFDQFVERLNKHIMWTLVPIAVLCITALIVYNYSLIR